MPVPGAAAAKGKEIIQARAQMLDRCIYRIAKNDREALVELFHATSAAVYGLALSILKNSHDAEDVLQECYINIASAARGYRSQGKPMAWIMTITRNLCLMKFREYEKISALPEDDWERYLETNSRVTLEDRLVLTECMNRLSDVERQIVVLHVVAGLKHREIAKAFGIPLPTVLSKHSRALKKLKKLLMEGERQNGE